ncbi:MAG: phosphoenolpyruvate--protein phosphotransferase [Burkholderiales bacterium]|nr:phosphoenolpyruvate--protein phosphotransferase [Burkholderiales bacterium]
MVSFALNGVGVSGGIAIGRVQLVSHATLEVAHYTIPVARVDAEIARFAHAVDEVQRELESLRTGAMGADGASEFAPLLRVHSMILADPGLSEAPKKTIAEQRCNAEWALTLQLGVLVEQFEQMDDAYLRERKQDVVQVGERVLKRLLGKPGPLPAPVAEEQTVLVAHDLSPADVIQFKSRHYGAFLTDIGGATSHTAIVARSLNVPAVVATHNARQLIRDSELVIVDGDAGVVIVNPDRAVLAEYRLKQTELALERQKLKRLRSKKAETIDGVAVELYANIELPDDLAAALDNGATGIGLFRSEFLFLNRDGLPSEDEQFEAYRTVLAGMNGQPVTIRTFDLGADKQAEGLAGLARVAANPALGLRAVRFCLAEPRLFQTQLRALLRASHYGKLRILVPMLASSAEIDQTLAAIAEAKASLDDQGVPFDAAVEVGGMIEIPAAVIAMDPFLAKLDFLSVGTNDLIQYTLAVDRSDEAVAHLYDPLHPAVVRLLAQAITTATKAGKPIAVCGEMAGEITLTRLLLGLGLRHFSMHPAELLAIKQRVLTSEVAAMKSIVDRIRRAPSADRVASLVDKLNAL